uniref:Uncharacterized protein n=1 Tax=Romanomermis culicivorax TaxID=13658 RepID=A0A915JJT4_ROMCU
MDAVTLRNKNYPECKQTYFREFLMEGVFDCNYFKAVSILGQFFCGRKFCGLQLRVGCGSHNGILLCGSAKMPNRKTAIHVYFCSIFTYFYHIILLFVSL